MLTKAMGALRSRPLLWPSAVILIAFGLRVLFELRSGMWEGDADYLMYTADQWLRGNPPWTHEFDDKLPFTYVLFIPAALARSIRVYQAQSTLIIVAGGISTASVFYQTFCSKSHFSRHTLLSLLIFLASIFSYSLAILPGSITAINGMAASLFMVAAAILFWPDSLARYRPGTMAQLAMASLPMAAALSLRPYFALAAILLVCWNILASGTRSPKRLTFHLLAWLGLLAGAGLLLNGLMFAASGNLGAFKAGLILLSQRLIPSDFQDIVSRQIIDTLGMTNLVFLSLGSCLLAPIAYALLRRRRSQLHLSKKLEPGSSTGINILFACILLPLSIEILILKKHYYPHYLQFFAPFGALSIGVVLLLTRIYVPTLSKLAIRRICLLVAVLTFGLMKADYFHSLKGLTQPLLDRRSAEYATLTTNKAILAQLNKGFLYPDSMSLHWKLGMARHGFPNPCTAN